jgi:hypothetical protein
MIFLMVDNFLFYCTVARIRSFFAIVWRVLMFYITNSLWVSMGIRNVMYSKTWREIYI